MRTHSLVQSSLLYVSVANTTKIDVDVSLFLPFHPGLRGTQFRTHVSHRPITRLPYFWADDVAGAWPDWRWDQNPMDYPGLNIYAFHPIHVALNSCDGSQYSAARKALGDRPLWSLSRNECRMLENQSYGSGSFLRNLVKHFPKDQFASVSQMAAPGSSP